MKKLLLITSLCMAQFLSAQINVVVSIVPQAVFVKKIAQDKVDVNVMVKAGDAPHAYEPKPSQMREIAKAKAYFSIGVEFEEAWLPRFRNQNSNMQIFDIAKGIEKIDINAGAHENKHMDASIAHTNEHEHEGKDPHVWTSPKNVKMIARNIYESLSLIDKENQNFYKENLDKFLLEIEETDKRIKDALNGVEKGTKFMVFHPSWGYFAQEYNLKQIVIEVEGKNPKPQALAHVLQEAKEENIKAIFAQPEFSDKIASTLAAQLNINVIKVSPLSENWSENLINLAKAIHSK